jgi:hypothetical protein
MTSWSPPFCVHQMSTKTPTSEQTALRAVLNQMYRADLLKVASALGSRPRSDHYRDSAELVDLIVEVAGSIRLKDDWLLLVDVPWMMYLPQPCLEVLKTKTLDGLNVEELREICREYSLVGFSKVASKSELVEKVRQGISDTTEYPAKTYVSRTTRKPIPRSELVFPSYSSKIGLN